MLVNSRKFGSLRWTACLALLAVIALSSCKKADDPAATNSSGTAAPGAESSPGASSTKASSKANKTLSPEIQKLGVKPTGTDCPSNAPIKGNIRKTKKIYHDAKSTGYKAVKPEICFKDVATAQKAGFEAPKGAKPQ